MYYILTQREELLKYLPKGGVGAEIGVAQGEYSAAILQSAQPAELHLIDPWSHLEAGSDLLGAVEMLGGIGHARARGDPFGAVPENCEGDVQYSEVVARFEGDARVQLHRQYSYKAAASFADGYFDFVYLDGNHHYEFVLQDLHDFAAKLKPGGLLFGHDFFEDAFARDEHYGVVDAVNSFVKRSDFRFLALTAEVLFDLLPRPPARRFRGRVHPQPVRRTGGDPRAARRARKQFPRQGIQAARRIDQARAELHQSIAVLAALKRKWRRGWDSNPR